MQSDQIGSTKPVAVTVDPSGARLAVSSLDGGVAIVDLATGEVKAVPGAIIASSLAFDGDGSVLGISVWGGEVRLYDVGSGEVPTVVWDGTGTFGAEPGWYDADSDSLWLPESVRTVLDRADGTRLGVVGGQAAPMALVAGRQHGGPNRRQTA